MGLEDIVSRKIEVFNEAFSGKKKKGKGKKKVAKKWNEFYKTIKFYY